MLRMLRYLVRFLVVAESLVSTSPSAAASARSRCMHPSSRLWAHFLAGYSVIEVILVSEPATSARSRARQLLTGDNLDVPVNNQNYKML